MAACSGASDSESKRSGNLSTAMESATTSNSSDTSDTQEIIAGLPEDEGVIDAEATTDLVPAPSLSSNVVVYQPTVADAENLGLALNGPTGSPMPTPMGSPADVSPSPTPTPTPTPTGSSAAISPSPTLTPTGNPVGVIMTNPFPDRTDGSTVVEIPVPSDPVPTNLPEPPGYCSCRATVIRTKANPVNQQYKYFVCGIAHVGGFNIGGYYHPAQDIPQNINKFICPSATLTYAAAGFKQYYEVKNFYYGGVQREVCEKDIASNKYHYQLSTFKTEQCQGIATDGSVCGRAPLWNVQVPTTVTAYTPISCTFTPQKPATGTEYKW